VYCDRFKQKLGLTGSTHLIREAVRWTEQAARAADPPPAI
jgi:hypothetical protein